MALGAADPEKAVLQPAALQVGRELLLHEGGQRAAVLFQGRKERRVVLVDQLKKKGGFGTMAYVPGGWQGRG